MCRAVEQTARIEFALFVKKSQKTCLHLHGVFPYIYVPYDGFGKEADRYLRQVAYSIDRALNVSMGNPSSNVQHIFKVVLVSGMYV
ncbi:DNA polymerase zeta catalytic subunit [Anabarilius grahami]|uniref:DNA polymerase zeta catalytic subunit n=1 Tax=Anabarilius grahami TaxID=495550 RepID=A0A3N0YRH7_ANAGA|nr:DNA polymerase zeta catalytic subunit [Anabarilius grahami]